MRSTPAHGARCAAVVDEEAAVTAPTPPADRCATAGREAAGPKDREADQLLTSLDLLEPIGWAPVLDVIPSPKPGLREARVEWWCLSPAASPDGGPPDHDLVTWDHGAPLQSPERGGKRGLGRGSSPAGPVDAWRRWIDGWLAGTEAASAGDEWDDVVAELVPVHWRPYEQRAITRSLQAPEVADHDADQLDHDAPVRRAGAEVRGWPEVAGHQRRNRGWQGRHRGSVEVGRGLRVREATKEERRLGERIAHCGEHLIFRAPSCECDPHARPVLVGADLCTHRLCHHCARLRSRKLGARVREMVDQLRGKGITRYALLTLTYRDSEVLEGSVSRCWRDFRKLRQRKLWDQVLGCVATMEIKRGKRSKLWHPHLHILIARQSCMCLRDRRLGDSGTTCEHGRLGCPHALNQCCISQAWREVTGDSYVVDVRAVHADHDGSMAGAVREVVKYCTKLTEVSSKERDDGESDVLELHRAIRGRRLLTTTGVFRGLAEPATGDELIDDPESKPCSVCGTPWETVTAIWDQGIGRYRIDLPFRGARGDPRGLAGASAVRSLEWAS
jgi:replication protein